jgi:hypothetical protein
MIHGVTAMTKEQGMKPIMITGMDMDLQVQRI